MASGQIKGLALSVTKKHLSAAWSENLIVLRICSCETSLDRAKVMARSLGSKEEKSVV